MDGAIKKYYVSLIKHSDIRSITPDTATDFITTWNFTPDKVLEIQICDAWGKIAILSINIDESQSSIWLGTIGSTTL